MKPKRITHLAAGMISCCAALPAAAQTNASAVQIPVKLREGDLMTQVRVNGSEPLSFKIDTGFGVTTIHPKVVDQLQLTPNGHMIIVGIAGEERADTYGGLTFDFGGKTYEPRRVASLPTDRKLNSVEQQTLAVLLQKFLDPPSVVREGEFDRAAQAGGFYERAKLALPKLLHGDSLPPIVIQEIRDMAKLYEKYSVGQIHNISRDYTERSHRRGLDPRNVVGVWMAPEAQQPGAPAGAAPGGNAAQRAQGYYN